MISPSVSIRAMSTPSCEVPLISPIASTGDDSADPVGHFCNACGVPMLYVLRLNRLRRNCYTPGAHRISRPQGDGNEVAMSAARAEKKFKLADYEHVQVRFSECPGRTRL